ncbi:MAG: two pore domain potassium channel family protein [Anaerolineae bacterium]|jgi:voltage-gated potassium channel|nr:two pore domain potassium channel family protein [Anaerolineae bacterium]MBT7990452.1 two pore domain potassium channel family protein [Anaerolineae bacterium]
MPAFLILFVRFFRAIREGLKDPDFRGLFYWVLGFLGLGTWFYARVEGWNILDSLYFSVITLTTVGYGDFAPQTPAGKLFTILYILIGLGLISGFVILLGERMGIIHGRKKSSDKDKTNAEEQR